MVIQVSETLIKKICDNCKSYKTLVQKRFRKNGTSYFSERWYRSEQDKIVCDSCYSKYIKDPTSKRIHNLRRFRFKNKRIHADIEPRIGVCNLCRAIVGQVNAQTGKLCKRSFRAHIEYHDDNPLKD